MFNICCYGNSNYSDSYRFSYSRFKFCFYVLVDSDLNVLFQICIFLKEVVYVQILQVLPFSTVKKIYSNDTGTYRSKV